MRISGVVPADLTPEILFLKGDFSLWNYHIPYFSSVVPAKFIADKFKLIDDIPDSERMEWSLEELFQRDISWERIEKELVTYLKSENRPQFFNALTIALLPASGHGFAGEYTSSKKYSPMADSELETPIQVGGIQIQYYSGSRETVGKIRWDVDEIVPVAVDGQHRLAAIRRFAEEEKPQVLQHAKVPVIFVVPDTKVGFIQPAGAETHVAALRRIFIDLNKNARPVSTVRKILLDDTDIVSVCTRTLIGERLTDKQNDSERIPLALVDWISEKNRIDTGPFLTTVLILRDVVNEILEKPDLDRTVDDEGVEDEEKRIERWLQNIFAPSESQLIELMSQVRRCLNKSVSPTFAPQEINLLREIFDHRLRPRIIRLIREISPYSELWEYSQKHGLRRPEIFNLYIANEFLEGSHAKRRQAKIKATIKAHDPEWNYKRSYIDKLRHVDENIKENRWVFKVVFQKAIFSAYSLLLPQAAEFVPEGLSKGKQIDRFTTQWIGAINQLVNTDMGRVDVKFSKTKESFWVGIGLRADETIDFTTMSSRRIARWLNTWVCMCHLRNETPSFSTLKNANGKVETILYKMLAGSGTKFVLRGLAKVVMARGLVEESFDKETIEQEAQKLMNKRYSYMRKRVKALA